MANAELRDGKGFCKEGLRSKKEGQRMIWMILAVLVILWVIGFVADLAGGLIHLLLVVAVIVFVINLVRGRNLS